MKIIKETFTYAVPDFFGMTTTEKGYSAQATYIGPDSFYVQIDKTGKISNIDGILEDNEFTQNMLHTWSPKNQVVKISAEDNYVFAYLLTDHYRPDERFSQEEGADDQISVDEVSKDDQTAVETSLELKPNALHDFYKDPDAEIHVYLEGESEPFFSYLDPLPVECIYDKNNMTYDHLTKQGVVTMIDYSQLPDEWEACKQQCMTEIEELKTNGELTQDQIDQIPAYIQEWNEIPAKYSDYPKYIWPTPDWIFEEDIGDGY